MIYYSGSYRKWIIARNRTFCYRSCYFFFFLSYLFYSLWFWIFSSMKCFLVFLCVTWRVAFAQTFYCSQVPIQLNVCFQSNMHFSYMKSRLLKGLFHEESTAILISKRDHFNKAEVEWKPACIIYTWKILELNWVYIKNRSYIKDNE